MELLGVLLAWRHHEKIAEMPRMPRTENIWEPLSQEFLFLKEPVRVGCAEMLGPRSRSFLFSSPLAAP